MYTFGSCFMSLLDFFIFIKDTTFRYCSSAVDIILGLLFLLLFYLGITMLVQKRYSLLSLGFFIDPT